MMHLKTSSEIRGLFSPVRAFTFSYNAFILIRKTVAKAVIAGQAEAGGAECQNAKLVESLRCREPSTLPPRPEAKHVQLKSVRMLTAGILLGNAVPARKTVWHRTLGRASSRCRKGCLRAVNEARDRETCCQLRAALRRDLSSVQGLHCTAQRAAELRETHRGIVWMVGGHRSGSLRGQLIQLSGGAARVHPLNDLLRDNELHDTNTHCLLRASLARQRGQSFRFVHEERQEARRARPRIPDASFYASSWLRETARL